MTAFSDAWLARFRERVNADPEMAVVGDWFTTALSLSCGERRCVVRFERGRIVDVLTASGKAQQRAEDHVLMVVNDLLEGEIGVQAGLDNRVLRKFHSRE